MNSIKNAHKIAAVSRKRSTILNSPKVGISRMLVIGLLFFAGFFSYIYGARPKRGGSMLDYTGDEADYIDTSVKRIKPQSNTSFEVESCEASVDSITPPPSKKRPVVVLRTNMLYDAALVPNIGIEVWLPKNFTLAADWFGTWLSSDAKHIYWQTYGGYLTLRYYFGKTASVQPYAGHHVGIYGSALTYDVEFGGKGYQAAKFGFGGGVEYGYSLPVANSLCIDFNIGIGYQGGEYKVYVPANDGTGHYIWQSTHLRRWFGPTKAEISLKWLIGKASKKKKGGNQ